MNRKTSSANEINKLKFHCEMDVAMHYVGGKWKTVVLWYLIEDKKRFNEIKKLIPNITEKMLSIQLKSLEEDGIIKKEVFNVKPPLKVEYSLTDFGKTLIPLLQYLVTWGGFVVKEKSHSIHTKQ
ncbi:MULTISPECIES: helix-turn-helix domain-containing protein [Chryseobacterium]|jgi:DNA-binding HxlR family transcriptional regulator|uniref:DNA-binding HxlR family transcriptional regulator n=1 Tax=Chryseobacterium geocarposphaerae TaxID=1416776 RepID=A0ABU1LA68_9FLAO|nr:MULTISPECIES: helix-turn-helix domain-containing protein [Chryseobacterium]MDR6403617.1 DNA-binding HxlR family transcriptional regulator [Chryseobacterium geocarposphaerae]MDR6697171.1 DNA-binding HxlR family transcriptional regulator [Chryseobacterium ginsenosidimutans]